MSVNPSLRVNLDNLNVVKSEITVAEKGFFETTMGEITKMAFSTLAEGALGVLFDLLMGGATNPDTAMLQGISNQLSSLQGEIGGIAMGVDYQENVTTIQNQITSINKITSTTIENLTSTDAQDLVNYISPGAGGNSNTDYSGCIDDLLNVAYSSSIESITKAINSNTNPNTLGTAGSCYASTINTNMLQGPTGIYTYVSNHMQLANTVSGLILGACVAANLAYTYITTHKDDIIAKFGGPSGTLATDINSALSNQCVQQDISDTTSATFLPTLLAPTLSIAPVALCGFAYNLVINMMMNVGPHAAASAANTNVIISNIGNGYLSPNDNNATYWTLQYNNGSQYWNASFVSNPSNTPSDYINFLGANGGYLGFMPSKSYVYEVISFGDGTNADQNANCQWKLNVTTNSSGQQVFVFQNAANSGQAMANNHQFFESATPGQYDMGSGTNPDVQWTMTF